MTKYRTVRFFDTSRYCCYGNHAAGSKPIYKLFNLVNWELVNVVNWWNFFSRDTVYIHTYRHTQTYIYLLKNPNTSKTHYNDSGWAGQQGTVKPPLTLTLCLKNASCYCYIPVIMGHIMFTVVSLLFGTHLLRNRWKDLAEIFHSDRASRRSVPDILLSFWWRFPQYFRQGSRKCGLLRSTAIHLYSLRKSSKQENKQ